MYAFITLMLKTNISITKTILSTDTHLNYSYFRISLDVKLYSYCDAKQKMFYELSH